MQFTPLLFKGQLYLHHLIYVSEQPSEMGTVIGPISQMSKLRSREVVSCPRSRAGLRH